MDEPRCAVEIGLHTDLLWKDKNSGLIVCTRHRGQYEGTDFGPFDWEMFEGFKKKES